MKMDNETKLKAMQADVDAARLSAVKWEAEAREAKAKVSAQGDELAKLKDELETSTAQLREMQDELLKSAKMSQLGQLTATIAHEIRNPLGSIRTSSFILERQLKDTNEKALKPLERIKNGVTRCDVIITELLDFARSRALQPETHVFDDWVLETIKEHKGDSIQAVTVEFHQGLRGSSIAFDPSRIERALVNMLSNAVEAMVGKADQPLENPTPNPKIVVSTKRTSRGVELSVTDNGPGINEGDMEKIFAPLFTTKSFGVGLGLAAVQKIFEQHGGGMEATSKPGEGATFTGWIKEDEAQTEAA